jgi:hypothetical protein
MSNYYTHFKARLGFMLVLGMASMAWTSTAASNEAVRIPAALLGAMKSAGIPTSAVSIHVQAVESTKPLLEYECTD